MRARTVVCTVCGTEQPALTAVAAPGTPERPCRACTEESCRAQIPHRLDLVADAALAEYLSGERLACTHVTSAPDGVALCAQHVTNGLKCHTCAAAHAKVDRRRPERCARCDGAGPLERYGAKRMAGHIFVRLTDGRGALYAGHFQITGLLICAVCAEKNGPA